MLSNLNFTCLFAVVFGFLMLSDASGNRGQVKIEGKPGWIIEYKPEINTKNLSESSFGGYYYILVDIQENLSKETTYCHYAIKLLNSDGVQDMSDLSIDFDPAYQTLKFHEINRLRNGIKTNELLNQKIKTVQREAEMERFLYDGRLTAFVNLEDTREGDIIEYSYSITGYNPIYKGNYFKNLNLEYTDPVKEIFRRIISPENKKLSINYPSGKIEPGIQKINDNIIYTWQNREVKSHIYDNNVPEWYNNTMRVEISSFKSWSEVAQLCLENYEVSGTEMARLKKMASEIFGNPDRDSVFVPVVRFVQDQVRYLGFESGLNGYKPTLPCRVMESRYADCKAKALLLCCLLKLYGIEAFPVLVNSNQIKPGQVMLPSPDVFNHCIVQVKYRNRVFNIDPTISNQGGDIENIYFPGYGLGLVLKKGSESLVNLVNNVESQTSAQDFFTVKEPGLPVLYKVITRYSGYYADDQRSSFKSQSLAGITANYLKFYSKKYPLIRPMDTLRYHDDRKRNSFIVEEDYIIDSLWLPVENKPGSLSLNICALVINSEVAIPASPKRTMPYHISFPSDFKEEIFIDLPKEWKVTPEIKEIKDSAFMFSFSSKYKARQIQLQYNYKTIRDYQPAETFSSFYSKHGEIAGNLYYSLTYKDSSKKPFKFSWLIGGLYLILLAIGIFFAVRIYRIHHQPGIYKEERTIGGWLILVAFGLGISTIKVFYLVFFGAKFFDYGTWSSLLEPSGRNIKLLGLLGFEFIFNSTLLIYLVLVQILFYKRRNDLPGLIIILYAANLSFVIIDTIVAFTVAPDNYSSVQKNKSYLEIVQTLISSTIWIVYFLNSKRVKETFTCVSESQEEAVKLNSNDVQD